MGRRHVDEAVRRAQFAVRDLTNSRIGNEARQGAEELRAQRLRDMGWDFSSDTDADGAGVAR